jgi:amino acid adenylation domain-containing protein
MNGILVHKYLDDAAELDSEKPAVTDGRTVLSFGELAYESNHLAGFLVSLGICRGDRVAYYLKRSPECITATMGILKAGAAYVPLDQKTPPERWRRIIEDAAPRAIICNRITLAETLKRVGLLEVYLPVICLTPREGLAEFTGEIFFREEIEAAAGSPVQSEGSPDDVAYVLYTSGSTGIPKGVMVTHGNVRNYIDWALSYFHITQDDRILGTAPFYFDMSTFDIFCCMAAGATFCLAKEALLLFPERLVSFMEQEKVTLWKGVSSLLMYICRSGVLRPGRMPSLRTIIFAGEPLDAQYLAAWMKAFPEKSFFNGYGPTEATGVSLCHHVKHVPEPGHSIPIGRPCKGAKVVLLGEDGTPVMAGEVGELCIAGECLAKGYLNDAEKTRTAFTPPPTGFEDLGDRIYHSGDLAFQNPDGDYVFISRKDHQVKWMGYRIELAEIEANLMAHPQVRGAAVLLASTGNGGLTELVAFLETEGEIYPSMLSGFLEQRIPPYMIPKRFIQMDSLPRNDRGKVARDKILNHYAEFEGQTDAGSR